MIANFRQETSSFHFQILFTRYFRISFFVVGQRCDLTSKGLAAPFTCQIGTCQLLHRYPMPFIRFMLWALLVPSFAWTMFSCERIPKIQLDTCDFLSRVKNVSQLVAIFRTIRSSTSLELTLGRLKREIFQPSAWEPRVSMQGTAHGLHLRPFSSERREARRPTVPSFARMYDAWSQPFAFRREETPFGSHSSLFLSSLRKLPSTWSNWLPPLHSVLAGFPSNQTWVRTRTVPLLTGKGKETQTGETGRSFDHNPRAAVSRGTRALVRNVDRALPRGEKRNATRAFAREILRAGAQALRTRPNQRMAVASSVGQGSAVASKVRASCRSPRDGTTLSDPDSIQTLHRGRNDEAESDVRCI